LPVNKLTVGCIQEEDSLGWGGRGSQRGRKWEVGAKASGCSTGEVVEAESGLKGRKKRGGKEQDGEDGDWMKAAPLVLCVECSTSLIL